MALLALVGALVYPQYRPAVLFILGTLLVLVGVSQIRPLALGALRLGERLPLVSRFAHSLRALYDSAYELLRLKNLLIGLGIGLVSWSAEGLAFYLVLIGLGLAPGVNLALLAIFCLALGSILGGASSLPGGLGAAEATMTGMLQLLLNLPENAAVTATLLIRCFTLWFAVALGLITVIIWRKWLFGENPPLHTTTEFT
jgi:glycosyltransferase 2 family protein